MHFVAYLYKEGLKVSTIKSYLAGICHAQIALDLGNPHIEEISQLEYVIRGVKGVQTGLPVVGTQLPCGCWPRCITSVCGEVRQRLGYALGGGSHVFFQIPQNRRDGGTSRCQL